jgi:hypothetical protein
VGSIVRLSGLDNGKSSPVATGNRCAASFAASRWARCDERGEDPGAELTPAKLRDLRRLAAFMVPTSA